MTSFIPELKAQVTALEIQYWGKALPVALQHAFDWACECLDHYAACTKAEKRELDLYEYGCEVLKEFHYAFQDLAEIKKAA